MEENTIGHKIGNFAAGALIALAIIGDVAGFVPFVKDFTDPVFWTIAGIYFWTAGMGVMNGRKLAVGIVSAVAGFIPGVQELPELTLGILTIIVMTRIEEKTGISLTDPSALGALNQVKNGRIERRPNTKPPQNTGGRRNPTLVQSVPTVTPGNKTVGTEIKSIADTDETLAA